MLGLSGLRLAGRYYAADLDLRDYRVRVSPLYDDPTDLAP